LSGGQLQATCTATGKSVSAQASQNGVSAGWLSIRVPAVPGIMMPTAPSAWAWRTSRAAAVGSSSATTPTHLRRSWPLKTSPSQRL